MMFSHGSVITAWLIDTYRLMKYWEWVDGLFNLFIYLFINFQVEFKNYKQKLMLMLF